MKINKSALLGLTLTTAAAVITPFGNSASADEPLFGFIYTTDLLPKDQLEAEQWLTLREGRSEGTFHALQARTEVSYGLADDFQISGYLNFAWADVNHNTPSGETSPPEIFADYHADGNSRFEKGRFESASVEAIYRFLSPYTDGIGMAAYIEPSIGPRTFELENRLIVQKNFLDDRLVISGNVTLGYEWRYLHGDPEADMDTADFHDHWDKETDVNFGLAASYRVVSNWAIGLELQNEHEWAGLNPFRDSQKTNQAWYMGPTVHYGGEQFFLTLTTLVQLPEATDYANKGADSFVVDGITNADDFENLRVRLKVGLYF
jgi:hypothetical protein